MTCKLACNGVGVAFVTVLLLVVSNDVEDGLEADGFEDVVENDGVEDVVETEVVEVDMPGVHSVGE